MTAKLTPLALAVLELLHERAMHPYEMAQLMRERHVDVRVKLKAGSLYHAVSRLEAAGHVEVVETQRDGRRPERTVYAMTDAGRDAFRERALGMLTELAEEYPQLLSGLAVLDELDRDAGLAALEQRLLRLRAAVASDAVVTATLKERGLPPIYWLDWKYVSDSRRFELDWLTRLVDDLRGGTITWQHCTTPERGLVLAAARSTGTPNNSENHANHRNGHDADQAS